MSTMLEEAYCEADVDYRSRSLTLAKHPDGYETIDCPVCESAVPASPGSVVRRYGMEPNFITGLYTWGWSPNLITLSCGHRIEVR